MKSFKIKTLGCKVNQYESQLIRENLIQQGNKEAESSHQADIYIVNTCAVTKKADKESRHALKHFLQENPNAQIIAAGCYAKISPDEIKAIDEKIQIRCTMYDIRCTNTISHFAGRTKAFIKVQDGCDNFCSYCVVPYARGKSISRNPDEILKEAGQLVENGYKEIVLTGICLGKFGRDLAGETLTSLIRKISEIQGNFRIRLSSIELSDITDELINEMDSSKKLCHHLHIPLQSGDDTILKKMNRRYTAKDFIKRIGFIRRNILGIAITTDIIVGFPGETDRNFNNTIKVIKAIRPSRTHIFTYSLRKATKAFEIGDTVPKDVKQERFACLKKLTDKFAEDFFKKSNCSTQRMLVENIRDKKTNRLTGYTDTYIKVLLDGPDEMMGRLTEVSERARPLGRRAKS